MKRGTKRDPVTHRTPAQMRKMDHGYNHRPEIIHERSMRNQARRKMEKEVGKDALKGKDVGHKQMVRHGGSNSRSNLRIEDRSKNRGWRKK